MSYWGKLCSLQPDSFQVGWDLFSSGWLKKDRYWTIFFPKCFLFSYVSGNTLLHVQTELFLHVCLYLIESHLRSVSIHWKCFLLYSRNSTPMSFLFSLNFPLLTWCSPNSNDLRSSKMSKYNIFWFLSFFCGEGCMWEGQTQGLSMLNALCNTKLYISLSCCLLEFLDFEYRIYLHPHTPSHVYNPCN